MFKIKILPLSGSAVDYLSDDRPVFGVSLLEYEFYCRFNRWVGIQIFEKFPATNKFLRLQLSIRSCR